MITLLTEFSRGCIQMNNKSLKTNQWWKKGAGWVRLLFLLCKSDAEYTYLLISGLPKGR